MASQMKKEAETRSSIFIQSKEEEEDVKYDPNMEIKTEGEPILKTEPGTIANPNEDLTVAQAQVSLVKSLISKTAKLEAEALEKDARLEQMRREMVEMKSAMDNLGQHFLNLEAEKRTLQERLDQQSQAAAFTEGNMRRKNFELKEEIVLQESKNESLQLDLEERETKSAAMSKRFAQQEQQLRVENLELKQKLDLEVKHREAMDRYVTAAKSLSDAHGRKIAQIQTKNQPAVQNIPQASLAPAGKIDNNLIRIQPDRSRVVVLRPGPNIRMVQQPVALQQPIRFSSQPIRLLSQHIRFPFQQNQAVPVRSATPPEAKRPRLISPQQDPHREQ